MYKCGWNGCEKAYGTLNHLNAHVTMQSHGSKRTPEGKPQSRSMEQTTCPPRYKDIRETLENRNETQIWPELTDCFHRVQRDQERVEGQEEGGGKPAKS
jgi:hypothetical protein